MTEIVRQAIENCAMRYCKGIPRGIQLWDERLSYNQKAKEIAEELDRMGYRLLKLVDRNDNSEFFITTMEGE